MQIQWYPGHMTKTKRMMREYIALVDIVIELLDARIPLSSKNPDIDQLALEKKRIVVLNKVDLAAPEATRAWEAYFTRLGYKTMLMDSRQKTGTAKLTDMARGLVQDKVERQKQRGRLNMPVRAMVAGIPNVGKSTLINLLAGRAGAVTGDKPGVTRGRQWIHVGNGMDLLDTPGVLWPKFEDENVGIKLAVTGAVSDDILDLVTLSEHLLAIITAINPDTYIKRYKLTDAEAITDKTPRAILEMIGTARGFKLKGGVIDLERAAVMVLDEFRGGKLGRLTLELPPSDEATPEPPAPASEALPQS